MRRIFLRSAFFASWTANSAAVAFSSILLLFDRDNTVVYVDNPGYPEAFNAAFRVFYRAMGTEDQFFDSFAADDALLAQKGVEVTRRTFPGGHDWSVWRRCIHDFLPMLFRE